MRLTFGRFNLFVAVSILLFCNVVLRGQVVDINPRYTNVEVGKKVQYTATLKGVPSKAVTWRLLGGNPDNGTISARGVYIAPLKVPKAGILVEATIAGQKGGGYVNVIARVAVATPPPSSAPAAGDMGGGMGGGPQKSAPVAGTSAAPAAAAPTGPPEIASVGDGPLPLGLFSATVKGKNLVEGSTARLNGVPALTAYNKDGSLTVSAFYPKVGKAALTVSNGASTSAAFPVQIGLEDPKVSPAAARRFLEQAGFGPNPQDALHVQALGMEPWINEQFNLPQISSYSGITWGQGGMPAFFLSNAVTNEDQLRQRVAFALSQIFVTSIERLIWNTNMIPFQNMLLEDSFTNYRKIMEDVTLSAAMGVYLDMANNGKGNPANKSLANENYARELMQLFTLGTKTLNQDGTLQLDANGLPIQPYTQYQVTEFARVFTGWTHAPSPGNPVSWPGGQWVYNGPLAAYPPQHDFGAKHLLNDYVSPAKVSPQQDLSNALDNVFDHPNVGPFVSTLLIQHLVKSNPSPAYVSRVAAVFNNNGKNVRGDMRALITAILLDPEARANDEGGKEQPGDGHIQEPALYIAGIVRAFNGRMGNQTWYGNELGNLNQHIFYSPSVFNYYAPDYVIPGTKLTGGEFQIYTPTTAIARTNQVAGLIFSGNSPKIEHGPDVSFDLSPFLPLASNPSKLVDAIDLTLTHGLMPAPMKAQIIAAVAGDPNGNLDRTRAACYLILTSSYYNVWH